jgi:hypothetical protein
MRNVKKSRTNDLMILLESLIELKEKVNNSDIHEKFAEAISAVLTEIVKSVKED